MNARTHVFELSVEGRQIEEVSLSIFHTLLFYRSVGKIRCACSELDRDVRRDVTAFADSIFNSETTNSGQITLEFYKRTRKFLFDPDTTPWERWSLKLDLVTLSIEQERQKYRERLGELLTEKIICINNIMNQPEYVPKMPNHSELDSFFDCKYQDVQPYLFRIYSETNAPATSSITSAVRKMFNLVTH